MRPTLALALVWLMMMQLDFPACGADNVSSQIGRIPLGATIEVHLKDKQELKGTRGEVSGSGFTLGNLSTGDRQVAFDDVTSVKDLTKHSHKTRTILVITGIAVVAIIVVLTHRKSCYVGLETCVL
jgi:hypothetical protein